MKLKLDENLGNRGAELFRAAGHEVATVSEQLLTSASDEKLINTCHAEQRCLITLDLDFSNPLRFAPGIIPESLSCDCRPRQRTRTCSRPVKR